MTRTEAGKLKVGDRVLWGGIATDQGTVIDRGYAAVTIAWDNGQTGTVDLRDMQDITRGGAK
jgi:hypothetical protein